MWFSHPPPSPYFPPLPLFDPMKKTCALKKIGNFSLSKNHCVSGCTLILFFGGEPNLNFGCFNYFLVSLCFLSNCFFQFHLYIVTFNRELLSFFLHSTIFILTSLFIMRRKIIILCPKSVRNWYILPIFSLYYVSPLSLCTFERPCALPTHTLLVITFLYQFDFVFCVGICVLQYTCAFYNVSPSSNYFDPMWYYVLL